MEYPPIMGNKAHNTIQYNTTARWGGPLKGVQCHNPAGTICPVSRTPAHTHAYILSVAVSSRRSKQVHTGPVVVGVVMFHIFDFSFVVVRVVVSLDDTFSGVV